MAKKQLSPLKVMGLLVVIAFVGVLLGFFNPGLAAAILCDLGIRNGRRNVEKILRAAEETPSRKMNPYT